MSMCNKPSIDFNTGMGIDSDVYTAVRVVADEVNSADELTSIDFKINDYVWRYRVNHEDDTLRISVQEINPITSPTKYGKELYSKLIDLKEYLPTTVIRSYEGLDVVYQILHMESEWIDDESLTECIEEWNCVLSLVRQRVREAVRIDSLSRMKGQNREVFLYE